MEIIIDTILGLKRKSIVKLNYDKEYDFAVYGNATFKFSTGSETFMWFYFFEFYRIMRDFLSTKVEECGYYDVDDYGTDYKEKNHPLIRISRLGDNVQLSFRWREDVYLMSHNEFKDCFVEFEKTLIELIEKKGNMTREQILKYLNL